MEAQLIAFILKYRRALMVLAVFAVLLLIIKVQRSGLEVCATERATIAAEAKQLKESNEQAAKRIQEQERQLRRREREVIKEINDESNSAGVGAADLVGMLCNQGAAGCSAR
jgi:predicted transglutaminase-like cysteine proteinase